MMKFGSSLPALRKMQMEILVGIRMRTGPQTRTRMSTARNNQRKLLSVVIENPSSLDFLSLRLRTAANRISNHISGSVRRCKSPGIVKNHIFGLCIQLS